MNVLHMTYGYPKTGGNTLTIQEQLQGVTEALLGLDNNNRGDLAEISRLTTLQNELTNQLALEARVQVQEEKVASIQLPYDFSEIFDDPRANEMISELIKDFQRQAYDEHNAEVEVLIAENKAQVAELKAKNDELQANLVEVTKEVYEHITRVRELESALNQAGDEREDALSKRDAAVREKEGLETLLAEKQEHIDKLREEIAVGAKAAINVTNISPSDRLAALVEQSKNAKVKSALDIALENTTPFRGKVGAVAELQTPEVTPFPIIDQTGDTSNQLVTGPVSELPADDQVTFPEEATEVPTVPAPVAQGDASETGKTLEERVKALELHVFGA